MQWLVGVGRGVFEEDAGFFAGGASIFLVGEDFFDGCCC